jgi:hypothetical protein
MSWSILKRAKLSENSRILLFDEPMTSFKGTETLTKILVNSDRMKVYDLLSNALDKKCDKIMITGTPGIGSY